ncbi:polyketide cyclase [Parafrankia colletiae]|uniref:Polyketide cyclase n=1 Tax=Parafrankia colletiae TaxID=573497 RepID=A0A1S1QMY1_9ACTN|nr:polyketide cyclase [Parafrankia colletiae]MCK9900391.1 SRPBCC family protein [Frankia sp. Cpl3]OHV33694.1 polyketide cyclase [Parafrankia colletiae]
MTWRALHLSQPIERAPEAVAAFAGNPENLPLWAAGLSSGIRCEEGRWVTDSPMGKAEVSFSGPVEHGVLDHDVTLPDGTVTHNPLRVLRNGEGSEVVFTLFQLPGVADDAFDRDVAHVRADLARLRNLLESQGR